MPFFAFGHKEDSWVIGNDVYFLTHNFERPNDDAGLLGEIDSIALGSNDMEVWSRRNGTFWLTQHKNLVADVTADTVDHLAFNPGGGWFISYPGDQARLSMEGNFSTVFHRGAAKYMKTKGPGSYALQYTKIWRVFFGAEDSHIFQFRDGGLEWVGIAEELANELDTMFNAGWTLTSRTCLSPHKKQEYYIEWTKDFAPSYRSPEYRFHHVYNLPKSSMLDALFVRQIVEGKYPTEIPLEEKPVGFEVAGSRFSVESVREMSAILFELFSSGENMTGQTFKSLVGKLIPDEDMAKIWELTDLDHNGEYSLDEFTLAWYLMLRRFGGTSVPKEIPMSLVLRANAPNPSLAIRAYTVDASANIICAGCQGDIFSTGTIQAVWFDIETSASVCMGCYCFRASVTTTSLKCSILHRLDAKDNGSLDLWCSYCGRGGLGDSQIMLNCKECNFDLCTSCHKPEVTYCADNHPLVKRTVGEITQLASVEKHFQQLGVSSPNGAFGPSNPFSSNFNPDESPIQPSISPQPNSNQNNAPLKQENDGKPIDPSTIKEGEKELREALSGQILKESPNVTWDDIAGLEAAKEELQEAVIFPIKFPSMFTSKRKPRQGILLYGPPGTGKSYLAKAVATEAGYTLFSISSSDVTSKWLGESERLVKTLFKLARENKPSVIFIDELDALCGSRDAPGHNPHMQGLKTEFMVQMDGVGSSNDGILLLAATNLPWSLDPAIRRRFQRKLYIPLPDEEARATMFKIHAGESMTELTDDDYSSLAKQTPGLSGSDISNAVQDALMQPVKKVSSSKHWRKVMDGGMEKLTPCQANDEGAFSMTWRKVPNSKLLEPKVEVKDFFTVLEKIKPTVSEEEIKKCTDWTDQFGTEGA